MTPPRTADTYERGVGTHPEYANGGEAHSLLYPERGPTPLRAPPSAQPLARGPSAPLQQRPLIPSAGKRPGSSAEMPPPPSHWGYTHPEYDRPSEAASLLYPDRAEKTAARLPQPELRNGGSQILRLSGTTSPHEQPYAPPPPPPPPLPAAGMAAAPNPACNTAPFHVPLGSASVEPPNSHQLQTRRRRSKDSGARDNTGARGAAGLRDAPPVTASALEPFPPAAAHASGTGAPAPQVSRPSSRSGSRGNIPRGGERGPGRPLARPAAAVDAELLATQEGMIASLRTQLGAMTAILRQGVRVPLDERAGAQAEAVHVWFDGGWQWKHDSAAAANGLLGATRGQHQLAQGRVVVPQFYGSSQRQQAAG